MAALLDALNWIGESLDKPGASVRGLLAGRPDQLANLIPFSDTLGITDPSQRVSGRNLLEQYGMLAPKEEGEGFGLGDIAGMGVEAALDPTNYIGAGALKKLIGVRKSAQASNANRDILLAKGAMPEELARTTRALGAGGEVAPFHHGTAKQFDQFDMGKLKDKSGIFFAEDPAMAQRYADEIHSGFDLDTPEFRESVARQLQDAGISDISPDDVVKMAKEADSGGLYADMVDWADIGISDPVAHAQTSLAKPRVISSYLDVQNPFNAMAPLSADDANQLHKAASGFSGQGIPYDRIGKLYSSGDPVTGQSVWDILRGTDSEATRRGMQSLGYDAVLQNDAYISPSLASGNIFAVFDPSQVYSPQIAPAFRQAPSISPLLAALGGQNVLARTSNQF